MKKIIFVLICLLLFTITSCSKKNETIKSELIVEETKEKNKNVKVFVISGQSNCTGESLKSYLKDKSGDKYYYYKNGIKNVFINSYVDLGSNVTNGFKNMGICYGHDTSRFGLELGLAETLSGAYPDEEIFIIKYSCGATSIYDHYYPKTGSLYIELIKFIKDSIDELNTYEYIPTIEAFMWMQGETESVDNNSNNYYTNLKLFTESIREDLSGLYNKDGLIFIDAGISNASIWTNYKIVNDAKKKLATESNLNYYIDTIENGLTYNTEPENSPDIAHFDSMSEIKLGNLFGECAIEAIKIDNT